MQSGTHLGQTPPKPKPTRSRVKPNGYLPYGFKPRYWSLWKYEWRYDEKKGEWVSFKPTYSPKTLRKFKWKEEDGHWHRSVEQGLWYSFEEALEVYRRFESRFDGIGYVLEPHMPMFGNEEHYRVVTDLAPRTGCRQLRRTCTLSRPWAGLIPDLPASVSGTDGRCWIP